MPMIHEAMLAVMRSVDAIRKDKKNTFHGYNFRGIDDVYLEMHKRMADAGVFMTSRILDERFDTRENKKGQVEATARLRIAYQFWAQDGSMVETEVASMGADTGDKAFNKALAAAHKYALLQAFLVPCDGMDDQDGEGFEYQGAKGGRTADSKAAPVVAAAPVELPGDTQYDPRNPEHKRALNEIFKKLGVKEAEVMRALSDRCTGVEIRSLAPTVEQLNARVPRTF